ncbi:MAG: hypothetical protein JW955_04345 [Sedimentisphaerales bacterium]|nr:hypothetical protein [Sedimentisphaerales bacterium]
MMAAKIVPLASILLVGLVHAEDRKPELPEFFRPHPFEIAPEAYFFRYEEPDFMKDEGFFYGLTASYTHRREKGRGEHAVAWSTFKVEGRFDWGQVDYDGALMDGTPYEIENIDDFVAGIGFLQGMEWDPTPFISGFHIGIAYRYLNDDTSFDPAGYEREANYLYLPIRLEAIAGSQHPLQVAFLAEVDVLLIGVQISHDLPVQDPFTRRVSLQNVYNAQLPFSGVGAQGSIILRYRSRPIDVAAGPFVRYWYIGESQESHDYVEPENNTLELGLHVILRF